MNYEQKWNIDLEIIADDFFEKLKTDFGIEYTEENLEAEITELFPTCNDRKSFFEFLDKNYKLNIRNNYSYEYNHIDSLIYKLYTRKIFDFFENNGINSDYETDFELFKMYMAKPAEQLNAHILKTLQKGSLFCADNDYICIKWTPSILSTDVIIKKFEGGFKVIFVYPGCQECNRNPDGIWYPDKYEVGNNITMSVDTNPYDFFDSFMIFDKKVLDDDLDIEPDYCIYGFAIAANTNFRTYLKERKLSKNYIDYDCISDEINPIRTIKLRMKDLVEFKHLGKKFFMFKCNALESNELESVDFAFKEEIPVFLPASILPRGTELFADDEIELQILLCGHQAVYTNPAEPRLESFKFGLTVILIGENKKSRAQIKEEQIAFQYVFPFPNLQN